MIRGKLFKRFDTVVLNGDPGSPRREDVNPKGAASLLFKPVSPPDTPMVLLVSHATFICRIYRSVHLQRLDRSLAWVRLKRKEAQEEFYFDHSSLFQPTVQEVAMMNELDENGWAPIHQAAFHGYVKSVEKFIKVR